MTLGFVSPPLIWFLELNLQDRPERAVRIFSRMKQLNIVPDIQTYELLFSLFGNVNAPYELGNILSQVAAAKRIHAIGMDMAKHNIQHSSISIKNLVISGLIPWWFPLIFVVAESTTWLMSTLNAISFWNLTGHITFICFGQFFIVSFSCDYL